MAERGKFISFEGGEGAGKSTQARLLKDTLEALGHRVHLTREPGGSPGAEDIRKLLVAGEPERWTPLGETLLFLAAREDHIARVIKPALAAGTWVISDRFADSTVIYQGIARGLGLERVRQLAAAAFGDFATDLTIMLDVAPGQGLQRAQARGTAGEDRYERFDASFHEALRHGFKDIAASEPHRCVVIDGGAAQDRIARDIWRAVEDRLQP